MFIKSKILIAICASSVISLYGANIHVTQATGGGGGTLSDAITTANSNGDPSNTIIIDTGLGPITTDRLPPITKELIIQATDSAQVIDGQSTSRLFVSHRPLTIQNCVIQNGNAKGGDGIQGGGGGLGAGGGAYIDDNTSLTLINTTIQNNQAVGGAGGDSKYPVDNDSGGCGGGISYSAVVPNATTIDHGGGDFPGQSGYNGSPQGQGGDHGGGNGGDRGGASGTPGSGNPSTERQTMNGTYGGRGGAGSTSTAGSAGSVGGGGGGAGGTATAAGGAGGLGGGGGGGSYYKGGGGGGCGSGGAGGDSTRSQNLAGGGGGGGFGAGGGSGGTGNNDPHYGGGGGGGGFGGGGGGGGGFKGSSGTYSPTIAYGGKYGGNGGLQLSSNTTNSYKGAGGGGAGIGGGLFIGYNSTLTIQDSVVITGNTASGGAAGTNNPTYGSAATAGTGYADDIFLFHGAKVEFSPTSTLTADYAIQGIQDNVEDAGVLISSGIVTLSSTDNNYKGPTSISDAAHLVIGHVNNLGNTSSLTFNGSSYLSVSEDIDLSSIPLSIANATVQINVPTTNNLTIGTGITGNYGRILKGDAGTLTLSGNNTFTNGISISAGTLQVGALENLGSGELQFSGGELHVTGDVSYSDPVNFLQTAVINVDSLQTFQISSQITGLKQLTKNGAGTLYLSNSNNQYGVGTVVNSGVLRFVDTSSLGINTTFPITLGNAELRLSSSGSNVNSYRPITLTGNGTINVDTGCVYISHPSISESGGSYSLTKSGPGSLVLLGANAYSGGTIINDGAIQVSASNNLGTGGLTLGGGEFLVKGDMTYSPNISLTNTGFITVTDSWALTLPGIISETALSKDLNKSGTGTLTLSGSNTYSGTTILAEGVLNVSAAENINSVGSDGIRVENGTLHVTNSFLFPGPVALNGISGGFDIDAGQTFTIRGNIDGNSNLIKSGDGVLTIENAANSYRGTTVVNGGEVEVAFSTSLGAGALTLGGGALHATGDLTFTPGVTLSGTGGLNVDGGKTLTLSGVISESGGAHALTKSGSGVLALGGTNTYSGGTTISDGEVSVSSTGNLGTGDLTLGGGALHATGDMTFTPGVTLSGTGGLNVDGGKTLTLSGVISESGGAHALTKSGSGVLALSGTNTYSGGTTISDGEVSVSSTGNLGTGDLTLGGGALHATGDMTFTPGVTLSGTGGLNVDGGKTLTLSGVISESGGAHALTKSGSGVLALSGTNTYSGGTTISDGEVSVSSTGNLGTGDLTLGGGALHATGDMTFTPGVTLSGTGGLNVDGGKTLTLSGVISESGGAHALTKSGSGVLALSGTNTYSGGTTISDGEVSVSSTGNLGTGDLTLGGGALHATGDMTFTPGVTLSGTGGLNVDGGKTLTLSGVISESGGAHALTKSGSGVLALSGTNTYSGGTTISDGEVSVSSTGNLGTGDLTLGGGALHATGDMTFTPGVTLSGTGGLNVDGGKTLTLSGVISESGGAHALTKSGPGVLALSGTNTYSGGTTISDGMLKLIGSSSSIANSNSVLVNRGAIFEVEAGAGNKTICNLSGSGNIELNDNALTILCDRKSTFSGSISGTGTDGIIVDGGGTLVLDGNSLSLSGASEVRGGCLTVDGILSSSINVGRNCILNGTGTVGTVSGSGTIAPGHSIGTLTIVGDYLPGPLETLEIELNGAGLSDLLIVTGNSTLDGTLKIIPEPGVYQAGTSYTIIQTGGVQGGAFSNVINTLPRLDFEVIYNLNSVLLHLATGGYVFPPCIIANAEIMAQFLEGCPQPGNADLNAVVANLLTLDQSALDMALAGLTPAQFGAFSLVNYNNSRSVMNSFGKEATKRYFCNLNNKSDCRDDSYCPDEKRTTVWVEPVGSYINQRMAEQNFGFHNWNVGSVFGAHHLFANQVILGGGVSYIYSNLNWEHGFGSSDEHNIYAGIFSGFIDELWYILGTVLGSGNYYDVKRDINFADIHRTAQNDHWGGEITGRLEGGINLSNSTGFLIRPFVVVDSYNVFQQGYKESGSDSLNLFVKWNYLGMVRFNGTIQISQDFQLEKSCWTPLIYAGYVHETPVTRGHIDANLEGCCCRTLTVKTFRKDRDQFQGGAGLSGIFKNGASFSMNYEIVVGHKYISHNGEIEFNWAF